MKNQLSQRIIGLVCLVVLVARETQAFVIPTVFNPPVSFGGSPTLLHEGGDSEVTLSGPEETVYGILQDMHDSDYPFRLVVVGNGAILETTSALGPTYKLGESPRTGEPLTTFASEDQSFEFHLMISQVSKIVMAEKQGENLMQIFRFLTAEGKPMCSLILADKSQGAQKWFASMIDKHGTDVQL